MTKSLLKLFGASGLLAMIASQSFAQDAPALVPTDSVFILNSLLFLIGGFLVFWMAAGFTMLEAGLVRSKNVTTQLTKNMGLFSLAAVFYYLIGYNVMYPLGTWMYDGVLSGVWGVAVLEAVGVTSDGADDYGYASTGSDFFFQLMFCAATASIVSGALAERIKLWPFLIFTIILTGLIYPIQASWKWGGGFLDQWGFYDFAGSTLVHSVGGWAALIYIAKLGARIGKFDKDGKPRAIPGHNIPFAAAGVLILWLGWFGFNGGSVLSADPGLTSLVLTTTSLAAAAGGLAAAGFVHLYYKNFDLTMFMNGILGGLVSITAGADQMSVMEAILVGGIGGVIVVLTVPLLDRFKIDDVVGAIPVHLFAGIWGTIAVVFTNSDASLGTQLYSIIVVGIFVVIASGVVWFILKSVMGIRVEEEDEINGLDMSELGMEAYPEFGRS